MFLRSNHRDKDGKDHTYWSLVETVRRPDGPRQRTLCYLGELNDSAQARWLKVIEVFNEQGERRQRAREGGSKAARRGGKWQESAKRY